MSAGVYVQWLGVVLLAAAIIAAIGVVLARSLFALCMHVLATGLAVAAFIALVNDADAGFMAAGAVGAAAILMICGVTLTARAVKPAHAKSVVRALGAAGVAALLIVMAAPQVALPAPAPQHAGALQVAVWLAPLMLTAAAACLGLLGFGERSAFEQDKPQP